MKKETALTEIAAVELKSLDETIKNEVKSLETKSTEIILDDIKTEDPKLYKEIQAKKIKETDQINTAVVSKLFKTAPRAKAKVKVLSKEIDSLGNDVYKKYFKLED